MLAWLPSWSCDQDRLSKLSFPHAKEASDAIWLWLAQWFLRRRCLKSVDDGRRRTTEVCLSYKLTKWAFGSGELISWWSFSVVILTLRLCLVILDMCDPFRFMSWTGRGIRLYRFLILPIYNLCFALNYFPSFSICFLTCLDANIKCIFALFGDLDLICKVTRL